MFKLSDLLVELREADRWLISLGFATRNDRFRQSIAVVEGAVKGIEAARRTGQPAKVGNVKSYHFGLVEALELRNLYRAFSSVSPNTIHPLLNRALSGPLQPSDETRKSAAGRNAGFELALAAEWKLRGGDVRVGEPDISLKCSGRSFLVECKRPWHEHSIRPNVKDAAEQVAAKVNDADGQFGVVAISVTRVLDSGQMIFVAPKDEVIGSQQLEGANEKLFRQERGRWSTAWFGASTVAVLFHAALAAVFAGKVFRATTTIAAPLRDGDAGFSAFGRELSRLYEGTVTFV